MRSEDNLWLRQLSALFFFFFRTINHSDAGAIVQRGVEGAIGTMHKISFLKILEEVKSN